MMVNSRSTWRKAARSGNSGNCVEVKFANDVVLVRDSKYLRDPRNEPTDQPVLTIPADRWSDFLDAALRRSAAEHVGLPAIAHRADGQVSISAGPITLTYTPSEWDAFCDGIRNGEFDLVPSAA